jgi:hypothetical protein
MKQKEIIWNPYTKKWFGVVRGRTSLRGHPKRGLGLGFFQDGDVGVGVFPEGEEILIGGLGLCRVALSGVDHAGTEK